MSLSYDTVYQEMVTLEKDVYDKKPVAYQTKISKDQYAAKAVTRERVVKALEENFLKICETYGFLRVFPHFCLRMMKVRLLYSRKIKFIGDDICL